MIKIDRNMSELRQIVCKNIYIILTLVHLSVLLSELFNYCLLTFGMSPVRTSAYRCTDYPQIFLKIYRRMLEWNHDDFQFTVHKAISSILSAPRALQIAPTNQPQTVAKYSRLLHHTRYWIDSCEHGSIKSVGILDYATISFLRGVLYGVRRFLRKCGMRMLTALN